MHREVCTIKKKTESGSLESKDSHMTGRQKNQCANKKPVFFFQLEIETSGVRESKRMPKNVSNLELIELMLI